jgi:hypothetical protein
LILSEAEEALKWKSFLYQYRIAEREEEMAEMEEKGSDSEKFQTKA